MSWRDNIKVHPAADVFPMMSEDELTALAEDIKANGLTSPISFFVPERTIGQDIEYLEANGVLADGRNRMEALERAGMELTPCAVETVCIPEPASQAVFIIGRNIRRRHLSKAQQADLIVAALKAAEEAEAKKGCKVCTVSAEPHKGGRGKVKPIKQKAIAIGKEQDIGKRTIQTALAKAEGKTPKPTRHRRTNAEIERDGLIRFADHLDHLPIPEPSDSALDLLPEAERDNAIEIVKRHLAGAKTLLDRLRISKAGCLPPHGAES